MFLNLALFPGPPLPEPGFDEEGADQLKPLVGANKWIGTSGWGIMLISVLNA